MIDVDSVYLDFCNDLPEAVRHTATTLPFQLELASEGVPLSRAFPYEFTLAAPRLVADGIPFLSSQTVRAAVLAHILAVLEAIALARLASRRISNTPELCKVLSHFRSARNDACCSAEACMPEARFDFAFDRFEQAIAIERSVLEGTQPADFALYDRLTAAKQSVMLPASSTIALQVGWSPAKRHALRQMLTAIACGLQVYENVVDWEDDHIRAGAWPCVLCAALAPDGLRKGSERGWVLDSGVLAVLLQRAYLHFAKAQRLAGSMGLCGLERWASAQTVAFHDLYQAESKYAGYAVRATALRVWAEEVLT